MPSISLLEITVVWEARQRRHSNPDSVNALADSMSRLGLIHPIVLTEDHVLVAGATRYLAARQLGWTHIDFTYKTDLSPDEIYAIELEENIKRQDLSWQDRTTAIAQYHALRAGTEPDWTDEKTAKAIGLTQPSISTNLLVAKEMVDNPAIADATGFKTALNTTRRVVERRKADEDIHTDKPFINTHVLHTDFNQWAPAYSGPKFNLLHCDFPYGINAHLSAGQNSSLPVQYDDSPSTYWALFQTLAVHLDHFCADSAHLIFWFSPNHYCQTREMLKLLDGFKFEEYPLIWQRGENEGIAPDPARRPRRVYEMAFFGWRGDRKIIRCKANSFTAPSERERHSHEKSQLALQHFFEMCVDPQTRLLDPTCGSGSALRAAKALGAGGYLGLERDEGFAEVARRALDNGDTP